MTATLRDGSVLEIRPIEPTDRDRLAAGFERLSPESRYRRFFAPVERLTERELDYLTHIDHHDHEALVGIDAATGQGVGIARYVRTAAGVAEPAVVVLDDWQRRGVGRALLDALVARALEEGIRRFEAPILATNHDAVRALGRLGHTSTQTGAPQIELSIDLPSDVRAQPRWGEVLRAFATGAVQPARTVLHLLWPRRPGHPDDDRRNVIVVGSDGSADRTSVIEAAATLAAASDASLDVVGVHPFLPAHQRGLEEAIHATAEGLRERGLQVREHVRRGDPALVLSDVAAEQTARLIVVGASGRSAIARRLAGSVADLVAQWAPCSVLVVRARESVAVPCGC